VRIVVVWTSGYPPGAPPLNASFEFTHNPL